jgi:hypothetical protein
VASWPTDFTASIPKTVVGQYEITVREPSATAGESPALIASAPGKYTLITKNWPPGLEANIDTPIRKGHFGVSSVGIGGEGAVSTPTGVTRVYRADDATKAAVLADMKPEPAPQADIVLEDPPNFEGKLTFNFSDRDLSWSGTSGWHYEAYRTLADTLLQVDQSARDNITAGKIAPRFSDEASKQQWLDDNFPEPAQPIGLQNAIRDLIINPSALDLDAIENHAYHNVLLQALASLPYNDRAFTRLIPEKYAVQPDPNDATKLTCIDNDIDGRAKGIHFFRVRAFDQTGNVTTLATSTPPIRVVGDMRPEAPVITKIEGGDRKITIRWAADSNSNIKGYFVYRTDDETKTIDIRLMGNPLKQQDSDEYSVKVQNTVPIEFTYEDKDKSLLPGKSYYYGVVAVSEVNDQEKYFSNISIIKVCEAFDLTPPVPPEWILVSRTNIGGEEVVLLNWKATEKLKSIVKRRETDSSVFLALTGWLDIGQFNETENIWEYEFTDDTVLSHKTYVYKIAIRNDSRNVNSSIESAEV